MCKYRSKGQQLICLWLVCLFERQRPKEMGGKISLSSYYNAVRLKYSSSKVFLYNNILVWQAGRQQIRHRPNRLQLFIVAYPNVRASLLSSTWGILLNVWANMCVYMISSWNSFLGQDSWQSVPYGCVGAEQDSLALKAHVPRGPLWALCLQATVSLPCCVEAIVSQMETHWAAVSFSTKLTHMITTNPPYTIWSSEKKSQRPGNNLLWTWSYLRVL